MPRGPRGAPSYNTNSSPFKGMADLGSTGADISGFFDKMFGGGGTNPGQPMPLTPNPGSMYENPNISHTMGTGTSGMSSGALPLGQSMIPGVNPMASSVLRGVGVPIANNPSAASQDVPSIFSKPSTPSPVLSPGMR